MLERQQKKYRRHKRIRAKIIGTAERPRLCVFTSINHIYTQIVDDDKSHTLVSASDYELKKSKSSLKEKKTEDRKGKILKAYKVGKLIAERALEKNIKKIVFDRGGNKYHGRVKALAEGTREGGLIF